MLSRQLKTGYFIIEGLNSFGTVLYFYYFYFYMQKEFGFGNKANLMLAALNGVAYALGCWFFSKVAHRLGYVRALKLGFLTMGTALAVGAVAHTPQLHVLVMVVNVLGMCFTWPSLESLVTEGEGAAEVPHMVGVYNVVWAATGAVAYFVGGALLDRLGLRTMFLVPCGIAFAQVVLTSWLQAKAGLVSPHVPPAPAPIRDPHRPSPAKARTFLRMAWLANPFAYIGINTLVAVIPGIASKLNLSTMEAGFLCSTWCFARLGGFTLFWLWEGWHYRFRWLLVAFISLIASFIVVLTVPNIVALVFAQIIFGGAIGLIYYSSLYYSMDASEVKGAHGGIHEAVIGIGNFAGPAVGAASLHFLPQYANSGALAVGILLLCGLGGLLMTWRLGAVHTYAVPAKSDS